jgi:molecular chaperone DnaJ
MIRNYFSDLELPWTADDAEVKKAYRRLARKFHPDIHPDNPASTELFRVVQEAYEFLSSTNRANKLRKQLEELKVPKQKITDTWDEASRISRVNFKKNLTNAWKKQVTSVRKKSTRIEEDLDIHLEIRRRSAKSKEKIEFQYDRPCTKCHGAGGKANSVRLTCKFCAGKGVQLIVRGAYQWKKSCDPCDGKGFQVLGPCSVCQGKGKTPEMQILYFEWPESKVSSKSLKFLGLGHCSFDGKRRGNVWLHIND